MKKFDVVALGELLIDFTENGISEQGNPVLEANPGGCALGYILEHGIDNLTEESLRELIVLIKGHNHE